MSFADPVWLLALLVVPLGALALWAAQARRRRDALRFPAVATLAGVAPAHARVAPLAADGAARPRRRRRSRVALAKPERTVAVPVEQASVVLVSDASGSMAATDVKPTRLDAARGAAKSFLDKVPDSLRVGLVGYSTIPHTVLRPTQDRDTRALDARRPRRRRRHRHRRRARRGARRRSSPTNPKAKRPPAAILLLSDGATTDGQRPGRRSPARPSA